MSKFISVLDFLRAHKCWVVVVLCALFVGFLDGNSLWERHYRWESIETLKREIGELQISYEENSKKLEKLNKDNAEVERVARERYYMTRYDEDLFIIKQEGSEKHGAVVNQVDTNEEEPEV
ncbi:MAG: septum formation initiator family protein [Bacteroidales bacterium]|nr:septum formation initiator family protein [Candidatus Physcousia equi]